MYRLDYDIAGKCLGRTSAKQRNHCEKFLKAEVNNKIISSSNEDEEIHAEQGSFCVMWDARNPADGISFF